MRWYDVFAAFYDPSLASLYAEARETAADALELEGAGRVLDVPVGTGLSMEPLLRRLPPAGRLLGVARSRGMLSRARARARDDGRVVLRQADVADLDGALLEEALGAPTVDRIHVFLGLTAFADLEESFARLWSRLAPGGKAVVVDVHAERPGLQGRMVNLVAQADIRRRAWAPFEAVADGFTRTELPPDPRYGGTLYLASGRKAG
ncbi:MAG: class I SAM-dependent methyltransferase [Sandaracinaceae bacterium]